MSALRAAVTWSRTASAASGHLSSRLVQALLPFTDTTASLSGLPGHNRSFSDKGVIDTSPYLIGAAFAIGGCVWQWRDPSGTTAVHCESKGSGHAAPSPFVYKELEEGIGRRVETQRRLMIYIEAMRKELEAIQRKAASMSGPSGPGPRKAQLWYEAELQNLQERINRETQVILYGVREKGARDRYMATYGCAAWTEEAIKAVAAFSPLIEIGAGKGHWEKELSRNGADIIAFDNGEAVPCPDHPAAGRVQQGDHQQIRNHPDRTLFLCYPEGEMAMQCLQLYKGERLLYVGEGRGGVNASSDFFDALESEWVCEQIIELMPFRENFEKLFVLRRKTVTAPMRRKLLGIF